MPIPPEETNQCIFPSDHMEIIKLIETLRSRLEYLMALKQNHTDSEVMTASQELDEAINQFYRSRS